MQLKPVQSQKSSGDWLSLQIEETLRTIFNAAFNVWAVITDNHAVNVLSFKNLRNKYGEKNNSLSINFDGHKVYNLYDSVHLVKNIRNKRSIVGTRVFTVTMTTVLKFLWKNYTVKAMNSKKCPL